MEGIGALRFGASPDEVLRCFGPCDESEELDTAGEHKSMVWHYWDRGFSVFFDVASGNRFSCVEIDDDSAQIWGKRIFEMKEAEIKTLFQSKGFRDLDEEDQDWGEKRVSFDDALIDFYFEKDRLISINYGVHLADTKDVIFPN